jgi:hypothetical protein
LTSVTSAENFTTHHSHGFFAGRNRGQVEAAFFQGVMNYFLQWLFVLDHEDYRHVFQLPLRAGSNHGGSAGNAMDDKKFKSEHKGRRMGVRPLGDRVAAPVEGVTVRGDRATALIEDLVRDNPELRCWGGARWHSLFYASSNSEAFQRNAHL